MNKQSIALATLLVALLPPAIGVEASEFRSIRPISAPAVKVSPLAPVRPATSEHLSRADLETILGAAQNRVVQLARESMALMVAAWNDGTIDRYLAPEFFDRQRFLDAMLRGVPRDARVRLLAVEAVHPLDQQHEVVSGPADTLPQEIVVTTRVTVVIRTQIEFSDRNAGFQRREGRNELVIRIAQNIPLTPEQGARQP